MPVSAVLSCVFLYGIVVGISSCPGVGTVPGAQNPIRTILSCLWKLILAGRINLGDWLPSLSKVLSQTEVILFWSFQIESEAYSRFKRLGGWTIISISPHVTGRMKTSHL